MLYLLFLHTTLFSAPLQYLVRTVVPETAFDTAPNRWNNPPDDGQLRVNIGFNFPFNNSNYTRLRIGTNGAFSFGNNGDFAYQNQTLSYRNISVYPYWDDLNPRNGGSIRYGRLGAGTSDERFVISWEGIPHYNNSGSYTFQAVIYPNGTIRFRYDSASNADGTLCTGGCTDYGNNGATIGVEETSTYYDQYSYDSAIDQTLDVLYTIPPAMNITKSSCVISDPVNTTSNPKRIPSATIRYAVEVSNIGTSTTTNVIVDDNVNSNFDTNTIRNLQIQNGICDCVGVSSASNNGSNGTANGVNPIILDFATVNAGATECGYFEVDIK